MRGEAVQARVQEARGKRKEKKQVRTTRETKKQVQRRVTLFVLIRLRAASPPPNAIGEAHRLSNLIAAVINAGPRVTT